MGPLINAKQLPCLPKSPRRVRLACGKGKTSRWIRHEEVGLPQCSGQRNTASISSCIALSTTWVRGAVHYRWLPYVHGQVPRDQYLGDPSWPTCMVESSWAPSIQRDFSQAVRMLMLGQHFEFIPFGSGRRICPRIFLSLQIMQLDLASLIHGFDLSIISNDPVDMSESFGLTNSKPLH